MSTNMKKNVGILILGVILLTGCTNFSTPETPTLELDFTLEPTFVVANDPISTEAPLSYLPKAGDSDLDRANAITSSIYLLFSDSTPAEVILHISGYLPTPCHELRIFVHPPDENNLVDLEVYSVAEPDLECEQVLRAFDIRVNLGTYPPGSYWVWVNGGRVGNFDF
jgi:hypothetical protein